MKESSTMMRFAILVGALGVVLALAFGMWSYWANHTLPNEEALEPSIDNFSLKLTNVFSLVDINVSSNPLPYVHYEKGGRFMRELIDKYIPFTFVDYNISSLFPDVFLRSDLKNLTLSNIQLRLDPHVVTIYDRQPGGMIGDKKRFRAALIESNLDDFVASSLSKNHYMFLREKLSGRLGSKDSELLAKLTKDFRVEELGIDSFKDLDSPVDWFSSTILSHPGVVKQTGYESQHMFYFNLYGLQRMIIFPPDSELYLFPHIHLAYSQSQVFLDQYKGNGSQLLNDYPKWDFSKALELSLRPGDLVYIPPFWSYRLEFLTLSHASIVQSPSLLRSKLMDIFSIDLPLGEFRNSTRHRSIAVTVMLHMILLQLSDNSTGGVALELPWKNPMEIGKHLLDTRYQISKTELIRYSFDKELGCPTVAWKTWFDKKSCAFNDLPFSSEDEDPLVYTLMQVHHASLVSTARKMASDIKGILVDKFLWQDKSTSRRRVTAIRLKKVRFHAVLKLFLLDFTEQLLRFVNGPSQVSSFLESCFVV